MARDPARTRRDAGDARDQDRARSARHPQPRPGGLARDTAPVRPRTGPSADRFIRTPPDCAYRAERSTGVAKPDDQFAHRSYPVVAGSVRPPAPGIQERIGMKRPFKITAFGAALVVLTVGAAPLLSSAADHIDASAFGSLTQDNGATFNAVSVNGERDINDVYAFQGANASRTVLAMTTNPAINAFGGKFGANVRYILNVDTQRRRGPGSGLRHPLRRRGAGQPEVHRHALHGRERGVAQPRQRARFGLDGRQRHVDAQGRRQGLRRRPVRSILLRPHRLRRDTVPHRDRRARGQSRPTSSVASTATRS